MRGGERLDRAQFQVGEHGGEEEEAAALGLMSMVFLPTHPSPARRAKSRSSSGAVSATASVRDPGTSASSHAARELMPVPDEAMIIGAGGIGRDAARASVGA